MSPVSGPAGAGPPAAEPRWAGPRVAAIVAARQVKAVAASPALALPPPVASLTMLAALAGGLGAIGSIPGFRFPGGYTGFQAVYLGLVSAAFGGVLSGLALVEDYESGVADRLLLAPAGRGAVLAGYVLAGVARGLVTALAVSAVAVITGVPLPGAVRGLLVVVLWALVAAATSLWAIGVGVRTRSSAAGPVIQLPVFLALFLGPVFVPRDLQSAWLRDVGDVNPLAWVLEASRSLVAGGSSKLAVALLGTTVVIALLAAWALAGARGGTARREPVRPQRRRWGRRAEPPGASTSGSSPATSSSGPPSSAAGWHTPRP